MRHLCTVLSLQPMWKWLISCYSYGFQRQVYHCRFYDWGNWWKYVSPTEMRCKWRSASVSGSDKTSGFPHSIPMFSLDNSFRLQTTSVHITPDWRTERNNMAVQTCGNLKRDCHHHCLICLSLSSLVCLLAVCMFWLSVRSAQPGILLSCYWFVVLWHLEKFMLASSLPARET